jgi:hypothetical protein
MKSGDKVLYLDEFKAYVISVNRNGIIIEFWGRGLQEGHLVRRRVAAREITVR